MFKKIDYIIYYEHISRELKSVKKLKSILDSRGYKGVILPIHYKRYINVLKYSPKIVIVPFLYSNTKDSLTYKRYKKLYKDIECLNLHSEQIYNKNTRKFMLPKDKYSKNIKHIAWGENFAKALKSCGVNKNKIFITGSIRNDEIFKYKKNKRKDDNILIPSSFSLTMVEDNYLNKLSKKMGEDKFKQYYEFMLKSRNKFFKIIYKLSKLKKNRNFFLRPHPHVDLEKFTSVFLKVNNIEKIPNNLKIFRKGSINQFFDNGNKVIVWHSTSILEAAMMEKEVIILAPYKFPNHMHIGYMNLFDIASNINDLISFVDEGSSMKSNKKLNEYIKTHFYRIDGRSSLRVAKVVENIIKNKTNRKFKSIYWLLKLIFKSILIDIPKIVFLKINLLDKVKKYYKGILEDSLEIEKTIKTDKKETNLYFNKKEEGIYVEVDNF